jgi:hypothetical protein
MGYEYEGPKLRAVPDVEAVGQPLLPAAAQETSESDAAAEAATEKQLDVGSSALVEVPQDDEPKEAPQETSRKDKRKASKGQPESQGAITVSKQKRKARG